MKKEKGFTLVELLVSIAIIATISGASLVYFRGGNRNWAIIRATQTFTQDIRRSSNMALSSPKITCNGTEYSPKGYGIYFSRNANTYILFGNLTTGDNAYDAPTSGCYSAGSDVVIETITMEAGTKIKSLSAPSEVEYISIVFIPPDPTVIFSNGVSSLVVVLSLTDESQTKQATINSKGNINID